jgi:carboxyl-terminal processing protease
VFPLADGSALKLTTALWYTPSGRSINRPLQADDAEGDGEEGAAPADTAKASARERFKTDAGRTVYGGGGITPDVAAGDSTAAPAEVAFVRALGRQADAFRDAVADYAAGALAAGAVRDERFAVTPAMRDAVYNGIVRRGVKMERATFDSAASLVDRRLAYEIARAAFGADAEFRRRAATDNALRTAQRLAAGARSQQDVFARAAALPKPAIPADAAGGAD